MKNNKTPDYIACSFLMLVLLLIFCFLWAKSEHEEYTFSKYDWKVESHYVTSGETYWQIAELVCPSDTNKNVYIEKVKKLNERYSDNLYYGETIQIYTLKE